MFAVLSILVKPHSTLLSNLIMLAVLILGSGDNVMSDCGQGCCGRGDFVRGDCGLIPSIQYLYKYNVTTYGWLPAPREVFIREFFYIF